MNENEKEKKKPPVLGKEPPSAEFLSAIEEGGTLEIDCDFCGITHFATWDYEQYDEWSEGEHDEYEDENDVPSYLIYLRKMAKEKPDWYIEHGNVDSIAYGYLNGKQIVLDCPCNAGLRYELFIKSHAQMISEYLNAVAQVELEKVTRDVQIAEKIKASNYDLERKVIEIKEQVEELKEREERYKKELDANQSNLTWKRKQLEERLSGERYKLGGEQERSEELEEMIKEVKNKRKRLLRRLAEEDMDSKERNFFEMTLYGESSKLEWEKNRNKELKDLIKKVKDEKEELLKEEVEKLIILETRNQGRTLDLI